MSYNKIAEAIFLAILKKYTTIEIKGTEHIPDSPCLVCANHSSHSDSVFLMKALNERLQNMAYIAAYDYWFENKVRKHLFGQIMTLIPIDRRDKKTRKSSLKDTIQHCKSFLSKQKKGKIVFYGTGSRNKGATQIKPGIILVSSELNIPILPINLYNTDLFFGKKSKWFKKAHIRIEIHPAIQYAIDKSPETDLYNQDQINNAAYNLQTILYKTKH